MILKRVTILFSVLIFSFYLLLVLSLLFFLPGRTFLDILFSDRTLFSIRLSIFAATISTLLSLFFGIPVAYALSRYSFFGKDVIDTLLELPMIVSPVALGAMILIFSNTPLGMTIRNTGVEFVFTIYGIFLAQFATTAGIAVRLIKATMDEIPTRYEDAAKTLGASPIRVFFTITIPLSKNGIIAAAILTWAKALGEFGATITVAGSMAMKTETVPIAIFMRLANADVEGTVFFVLILILVGLGTLYGVRVLTKKPPSYTA